MPATWGVPRSSNLWDQQDIEQYHRLPIWMAMQETKKIAYWSRWKNKYGTIKWEQNMGDILQGIIAENSPIGIQTHRPRNITEIPLKTVARHYERTNSARVKRHLFESPLFHFLPSFRDFRKKQLRFAADDLSKQIAVGYDMFIREQILQQSPNVYIVGNATANEKNLIATIHGDATDTFEPKDDGWRSNMIAKVGAQGFLDFRNIVAIRSICRNSLQIPPWEGMTAGKPGDNEVVKGKFLLTGDPEIYEAMSFDTHVLNTRPLAMNLLNSEFHGVIGENIVFQAERYPYRIAADGTLPAPEVEEEIIDNGPTTAVSVGQGKKFQTVPNAAYVNAPFGVAFFEGYQAYESIDIGPPPSEFSTGSISTKKFNRLNWNGEVRITDDVLVNYGNNNLDTNKWGEYLQLIADTVLGIIANTPRYIVPIVYRRNATPSLSLNE